MLSASAFAKINLSLEILGRRPDGYHNLVSVMQEISLADHLAVKDAPGISLACSDPALVPNNLVTRAAELLRSRYNLDRGCEIHLVKRIPVGAGLGGGSSDAAACLVLLNHLWSIALGTDELEEIAAELGSDVPFFVRGGIALVEGRGERVTPLPHPPSGWVLLCNPGVSISTAQVFSSLRKEEWSDGTVSYALAGEIRAGKQAHLGVNSLEAALFRLSPHMRSWFDTLAASIPTRAMISGSGPTAVALFPSEGEARQVAETLGARGVWTHVAFGGKGLYR